VDFSALEMRILGLRANDDAMTQAFFDGEDIHKATASLAFDTPIGKVTKDQRQAAKAVSFGEIPHYAEVKLH